MDDTIDKSLFYFEFSTRPGAFKVVKRTKKISPTRFELVTLRLSNYSLTLFQLSYGEDTHMVLLLSTSNVSGSQFQNVTSSNSL